MGEERGYYDENKWCVVVISECEWHKDLGGGAGRGVGGGLVIDILCELIVLYYIFEIVGIFNILYIFIIKVTIFYL